MPTHPDSIVVVVAPKSRAATRVTVPAVDERSRLRTQARRTRSVRSGILMRFLRARGAMAASRAGAALAPGGMGGFASAASKNMLAAAAAIVGRIAADRSTENIAENIKQAVLGDAGIEAEARGLAREWLLSLDERTGLIGRTGVIPAEFVAMTERMKLEMKREVMGRAFLMMDKRFQVNTTFFDQVSENVGDRLKKEAREFGFKNADMLNRWFGFLR